MAIAFPQAGCSGNQTLGSRMGMDSSPVSLALSRRVSAAPHLWALLSASGAEVSSCPCHVRAGLGLAEAAGPTKARVGGGHLVSGAALGHLRLFCPHRTTAGLGAGA